MELLKSILHQCNNPPFYPQKTKEYIEFLAYKVVAVAHESLKQCLTENKMVIYKMVAYDHEEWSI